MKTISIIVPCFNEAEALPFFKKEMDRVMESIQEVKFELIFVNDGSKDTTLSLLKAMALEDSRVKYISFSRNFGKEAAIYAGLENASGDFVGLMDADLQDPPSMLEEMYTLLISADYDCICLRRVTRKGEPIIKSFFARTFYKLINKMSQTEMVDGARDYRLMTRQMVDEICRLKEVNRYSKGLFSWVGFHTKWLEYENVERVAGETKWSFYKLMKYAVEGIVNFSTAPLALASIMGFLFCIAAFIGILFIFIRTAIFGDATSGWPSLACIVLFVGGIQLFCFGILGSYLSRTYLEVKGRPIYIAKESNIKK